MLFTVCSLATRELVITPASCRHSLSALVGLVVFLVHVTAPTAGAEEVISARMIVGMGWLEELAVAEDAGQFITLSGDGRVRLWGAATGEMAIVSGVGVECPTALAFSPEGGVIADGNGQGEVSVWRKKTRHVLGTCVFPAGISCLAFSPGGRHLAAGLSDGTIGLWDTSAANPPRRFGSHAGYVFDIEFSPEGERIATGSEDGSVNLWSVSTGALLLRIEEAERVRSVAFLEDGSRIIALASSIYERPQCWDAITGKTLWSLPATRRISCFSLSPDGASLATGSEDGKVHLWESRTGTLLRALGEVPDGVSVVRFLAKSETLILACYDGTLWFCDTSSARMTLCPAHFPRKVLCVAFSPGGGSVFIGTDGGAASLWDASSGKELRSFGDRRDKLESVAFSRDGSKVVTGSGHGDGRVWDVATGRQIAMLSGQKSGIRSIAFSPEGTKILTGTWSGMVGLWDAGTGSLLLGLPGHPGAVEAVAFCPDGRTALSGSFSDGARLWDLSAGRVLASFSKPGSLLKCVGFSPTGPIVVMRHHDDYAMKLWEINTGRLLATFPAREFSYCVAVSEDGRRVLIWGDIRPAALWDATTGEKLCSLQNDGRVTCVAFSRDGAALVTGGVDGTARLWTVPAMAR